MANYDPGVRPEVRADGADTTCEAHDAPGACTQDCADFMESMTYDGGGGETMIYGDYLGGTSSVDVSGCHGRPPMPDTVYRFDPDARRVYVDVVHPDDCQCGCDDCPMMTACDDCGAPEGESCEPLCTGAAANADRPVYDPGMTDWTQPIGVHD